jgi:uncharacterized caspase-like protein
METRIALVIGNANYQSAPLRNPRNDARAIASVLQRLNFVVLSGLDLNRDSMEDKLSDFETRISQADVALIYYAGHGLQVNGQNYLIPVDAEIRQEIHLKRRAFSLDELLAIMSRRARSSLIFLDACRDNPFARTLLSSMRPGTRSTIATRSGLAEVRASRGSFVAFATAPDNVAGDGSGINSPFTEALLAHIETPAISISDLMIEVRKQVLKATGDQQEPWDQSSLRERFCFNPSNVISTPDTVFEAAPRPIPVAEPILADVTNDESRSTEIGVVQPTKMFLTLLALVVGVGLTAIPLSFLVSLFMK